VSVAEKLKNKDVIHWVRNDQRVSDHEIFSNIESFNSVSAFYIFDEKYNTLHPLDFPLIGQFRKQFLKESLDELSANLKHKGVDFNIFTSISEFQESKIYLNRNLTYLKQYGTEELDVEAKVLNIAGQGVALDNFTLVDKTQLPFSLIKLPDVFTAFRNKVEKYGAYQSPIGYPFVPNGKETYQLQGGETAALSRIKNYFWESKNLSNYKETRNGLLGTNYSSRLSPWLANGNISARSVYTFVKQYEEQIESNDSTYWLVFELLWRDFFQLQLQKNGASFFKITGTQNKAINYRNNDKAFYKWANGETQDDFVNANMKELAATGWMSNRGRQNVASYLIHDLGINWTWGAAWFESLLLDYDPASNWGNWMYIAGVGNDPRPFRKFNTKMQAERYDPTREYTNLWNT
jgi:deoxyribodipyrimidine photo-lyase